MSLALRLLTPAEVAAQDEYLRQASVAHAWHQWALSCCTERGGHWWHLEIDPDEGVSLTCRGCPADMGDLGLDDPVLALCGEFEVYPGYVLKLDEGRVVVNDRYPASSFEDGEPFTWGWRGPVTVTFRIEKYGGWEYPAEYDVWTDLEAAP